MKLKNSYVHYGASIFMALVLITVTIKYIESSTWIYAVKAASISMFFTLIILSLIALFIESGKKV